MTEPHSVEQWIAHLEVEALAVLSHLSLPAESIDDYQVTAESCAKHDQGCIKVRYGFLMEHFRIDEHAPGELARSLVERLMRAAVPPT